MEFESDFVKEEPITFEIEGRKFGYKPTTAGEENDWLDEYIEADAETGKAKLNHSKLTELRMRNLVAAPYSLSVIKAQIGVEKEWKDLNHVEKWLLLRKLTPSMFNKIVEEIQRIDGNIKDKEKKT